MDAQVRLDAHRLRELLAEQHEYDGLDFKESVDPREQRDLVELVKDLAAMSAEGGYVVVGVDDSAAIVGLDPALSRHLDEANLRGRVRRYLPDIDVRTAVHEIDGKVIAAIWVGQHPDGFAVLAADGQFRDRDGNDVTLFRQGDVYVRRGSASVRMDHRDMQQLRHRFTERVRTQVRREWAADLTASQATTSTKPRLTLDMPIEDFAQTGADLLRAGDVVPVRLLLAGIKPRVIRLLREGDVERFAGLLDHVSCLSAMAIVLDIDWLLADTIAAMATVYEVGHERDQEPGSPSIDPPNLWLAVIQRVYGLGALAVRMARWTMARDLALRPGEPSGTGLERTWLRHALTHAARAGLLGDDRQARGRILELAADQVTSQDYFHPDQVPEARALLDSLCQFDALAGLAVIAAGGRATNVYPSFGRFEERRTEPIIVRLIQDASVRGQVAPLDDQDLADAIRYLDASASQEFFFNWDRFYDARIGEFLSRHPARRTA